MPASKSSASAGCYDSPRAYRAPIAIIALPWNKIPSKYIVPRVSSGSRDPRSSTNVDSLNLVPLLSPPFSSIFADSAKGQFFFLWRKSACTMRRIREFCRESGKSLVCCDSLFTLLSVMWTVWKLKKITKSNKVISIETLKLWHDVVIVGRGIVDYPFVHYSRITSFEVCRAKLK